MSEADDLFAEAYRLSVVEEKHREAIDICREALTVDADNFRIRVFLGMLLSDYGTTEEKEESREYFMDAIAVAKNNAELCDNWFEESALHHLAIWKWNHENRFDAGLLFLADVLTCRSKESYEYLIKLLDEVTPQTSSDMKLVVKTLRASSLLSSKFTLRQDFENRLTLSRHTDRRQRNLQIRCSGGVEFRAHRVVARRQTSTTTDRMSLRTKLAPERSPNT